MNDARYELEVTAPAARAIGETLPESVAFAVIELMVGPLLESPSELAPPCGVSCAPGAHDAGRTPLLYRIDTENHEVIVLTVGPLRPQQIQDGVG